MVILHFYIHFKVFGDGSLFRLSIIYIFIYLQGFFLGVIFYLT